MPVPLPSWYTRRGPRGRKALRPALLLLLLFNVQVMSTVLDEVISKRTEYRENCTQTLARTVLTGTGIYCNGSFDKFVCWPHSHPGNVSVPCPTYLPWIKEGLGNYHFLEIPNDHYHGTVWQEVTVSHMTKHGYSGELDDSRRVHGECLANGSWRLAVNSTNAWRDQIECESLHHFKSEEDELFRHAALRVVSIIGYSLSLTSLCLATLLMAMLRKLHCTRNYVHMNLFISFILRAVAVITKEIVLYIMYSEFPQDNTGWNSYLSSATAVMCKVSKVSMEYFVACNYFWLLVEALFLHTLLFTAVLTKRRFLRRYMFIGWGTPFLFVVPWTVVKILYENTGCWTIVNRWYWWIIRGPITLSVLVIFFIFIKIIMLLLSKLKADQMKFTDYRYRLARATLVLIPLLGIHEVVFTILIDECVEGSARYARNFLNLTLSSFQGLLVSVLYCFANGEVQAELKKRWQLLLLTNRFQIRNCFRSAPFKHLWKGSRGQRPHGSQQSESYEEGGASTHPHLLQVAVHSGGELGVGTVKGRRMKGRDTHGLEFLTRKSLSSSDGEMTQGETMEEILEESEF